MKIIIGVVGLFLLAVVGVVVYSPSHEKAIKETESMVKDGSEETMSEVEKMEVDDKVVVTDGVYTVDIAESIVRWAGQKPLIDGYVNSGVISLASGEISVNDEEAVGSFTVDMDTLSVSATPAKPGKESVLESHLRGEGWFAVEEFPEASFVITNVSSRPDSAETFLYDVTGTLTMKGKSGELMFPAMIYLDGSGTLHAAADFEFDRTLWGITSGSGSFFDGLADNVVDDMVALSFELVAR